MSTFFAVGFTALAVVPFCLEIIEDTIRSMR
jgi:hypothetical protein